MTGKRLALLIGVGVAAVAAFFVLTVVPLALETGVSQEQGFHAATGAEAPLCGELDFAAEFHYSVERPLVDLWGFAVVRDLTMGPAEIAVNGCDERSFAVGGHAGVRDDNGEWASETAGVGNSRGPGATLVRGEWCPETATLVTFEVDGALQAHLAFATDGGLCLDLS